MRGSVRAEPAGSASSRGYAAAMHGLVPALSRHITERIQAGVSSYAGPATGRRHRLIVLAVSGAVHHFVARIEGSAGSGVAVEDLFRRMGRGEAADGRDLTAMRQAIAIATRDAWDELQRFAVDHGLAVATLGRLGEDLLDYMEHLVEQVALGHRAGMRALRGQHDRALLLTALLDVRGADLESVRALAATACWELPSYVVGGVVDLSRATEPRPSAAELDGGSLSDLRSPRMVVVAPADQAVSAMRRLVDSIDGARAVHSWPVPLCRTSDAVRWSWRVADLTADELADHDRILDCRDRLSLLTRLGEPEPARMLRGDLLAPLEVLGPRMRAAVIATLTAWLPTRPSAPDLAELLGVHPQTMRYRMRRARELLGEVIDDPDLATDLGATLRRAV